MKKTLLIGLTTLFCSFSEQEATPLPSEQIQKLNGGTINAAQINNEGKPIIRTLLHVFSLDGNSSVAYGNIVANWY